MVEHGGEEAGFVKECAAVTVEDFGGGGHGVVDTGEVDGVECYIVYYPVADSSGIFFAVGAFERGEECGSVGEGLLGGIGGFGTELEFDVIVCSGRHVGFVDGLGYVVVDIGVAVGVAYFIAFDGAVLVEVEALGEEGGAAFEGVVEDDGAVVFECSVDDGHFAEVVEAAAVGAFGRKLENEGVLRGVDFGAVGTDGVAFVDGEGFESGVVGDEGFALVGVSGDGTVAKEHDFFMETELHGAVAIDFVTAADEVVLSVGLFGLRHGDGGDGQRYDGEDYFFHE